MHLTIATCQFPTSDDIEANRDHILRLMQEAADAGADIAHFPECCLSGYAGADLPSHEHTDWDLLAEALRAVRKRAAALGIWAIVGSAHRLTPPNKPHNSLYVIASDGQIVDRYDKRFCAGPADAAAGDLAHYSPGNHFGVFDLKGIRCGLLICHDYRYPELVRAYKRRGVQVLFHSFHAAGIPGERWREMEEQVGASLRGYNTGSTLPAITMPATMIARAASSHVWISAPNSSAERSCWGSFFVRADGVITGQLDRHATGVLVSHVDTGETLYDSTKAWRQRAIEGELHSGVLVEGDPLSEKRGEV